MKLLAEISLTPNPDNPDETPSPQQCAMILLQMINVLSTLPAHADLRSPLKELDKEYLVLGELLDNAQTRCEGRLMIYKGDFNSAKLGEAQSESGLSRTGEPITMHL